MTKKQMIGLKIAVWLIGATLLSACGSSSNPCGNGVVDPNETCDTKITSGDGVCPTSCTAPNACTTSELQNAGTCTAKCVDTPIVPCCGNGAVEAGETCDTAIVTGQTGACPTTCPYNGEVCTSNTLQNAGTCTASCEYVLITSCTSGDGCCPSGCDDGNNDNADNNCNSGTCGDGVVNQSHGETCDKGIAAGTRGACPTSCTKPDACTSSTLQGSVDACTATCYNEPITTCVNDHTDGCCPTGCTPSNDSDCIDLTGTWISRFTAQGTLTAGTFIIPNSTIEQIQRIYITKSGSDLNTQFEICGLTTTGTSTQGTTQTTFSIDYSTVLSHQPPLFTTSPTETDFRAYVGGAVVLPDFKVVTGWDASHNSVDSDGDGTPGITLVIGAGPLSLSAYTGLTMTTIIKNATLQDANTIEAIVDYSTVGNIFASNPNLVSGSLAVTPDSNAIQISLIRLSGNASCSEVKAHCTGTTCLP